ncbi:hypothetical protein A3K72_03650 [Candidatus Woesearchaeota archaeon RBG_13_36_6]|nr:MAG: hypothetical protein A3K72_03650 [Candidatus Woesearchaeota archaeon RBG_13_36_6]
MSQETIQLIKTKDVQDVDVLTLEVINAVIEGFGLENLAHCLFYRTEFTWRPYVEDRNYRISIYTIKDGKVFRAYTRLSSEERRLDSLRRVLEEWYTPQSSDSPRRILISPDMFDDVRQATEQASYELDVLVPRRRWEGYMDRFLGFFRQ